MPSKASAEIVEKDGSPVAGRFPPSLRLGVTHGLKVRHWNHPMPGPRSPFYPFPAVDYNCLSVPCSPTEWE